MDYFWLKSDKRYLHTPNITNLREIVSRRAEMSFKNASNIKDINVGFARSEEKLDYIDILDSQLYLVNDAVRQVFSMYEPAMIFKTVCILNNLDGSSCNYNAPLFFEADCLPEEYKPVKNRNRLERLIIKADEIRDYGICRIAGIDSEIVLVRLDVAESLLRRSCKRLVMERVKVE